MSDQPLPDDLSEWPTDPYRLLGVRFGVTERELKRAYHRLIRAYKPEHFPQQFTRIRAAYETIVRHVAGFTPRWTISNERERSGSDGESPQTPSPPSARPPAPVESSESLWERGRRGEREAAYRGLQQLAEQTPGQAWVVAPLYWLLVVYPELDPARSPCDWLARGLKADGTQGALRELYRREIDVNPSEVLESRSASLMGHGAPAGLVLDLADWRWRAATRLERWDVIVADITALRAWGRHTDEPAWIRLLMAAVMQLAWGGVALRGAVSDFCREIEKLNHLHGGLADDLVQVDYVLELSSGWLALKACPDVPSALLAVFPEAWNRPPDQARPLLRPLWEQLARHPQQALRALDIVREKAPTVLAFLAKQLEAAHDGSGAVGDPRSTVDHTRLILEFLAKHAWWQYKPIRPQLLQFCLREAIAPDAIARAVDARDEFSITADEHLSHAIDGDWPLRQVYLACEVFWTNGQSF